MNCNQTFRYFTGGKWRVQYKYMFVPLWLVLHLLTTKLITLQKEHFSSIINLHEYLKILNDIVNTVSEVSDVDFEENDIIMHGYPFNEYLECHSDTKYTLYLDTLKTVARKTARITNCYCDFMCTMSNLGITMKFYLKFYIYMNQPIKLVHEEHAALMNVFKVLFQNNTSSISFYESNIYTILMITICSKDASQNKVGKWQVPENYQCNSM